MSTNTILILALLALLFIGAALYIRYLSKSSGVEEQDVNYYILANLERAVNEAFQREIKQSLKDSNDNAREYQLKMRRKEELKADLRTAAHGDSKAKRFLIGSIMQIIENPRVIDISQIDRIIPFDRPEMLKGRDKFEILTFLWIRGDSKGFSRNFSRFGLDEPTVTPDGDIYVVTKEMIDDVYDLYMDEIGGLTIDDKKGYLAQRIYEDLIGLGAADLLLETDIDEVQGGTSGIPADRFDIKLDASLGAQDMDYSYDSVWIVYHGLNIHLRCTGFGTQKELVRVVRNIYRYNAPTILSKRDPKVIGTMKNGNRISVMCPDFAESYAFLARKFDSTPSVRPEKLLGTQGFYTDNESDAVAEKEEVDSVVREAMGLKIPEALMYGSEDDVLVESEGTDA